MRLLRLVREKMECRDAVHGTTGHDVVRQTLIVFRFHEIGANNLEAVAQH